MTMNEIEQVTQAVFGDTPIRTGYSTSAGMSFAVAADLRGALKHGGSMNSFLRGLEKSQETAGQTKGNSIVAPLYVGRETVQTPGGPQQMKVIYKRGVFQLLMLSRKPEATQYRDKVFDVLEQIERDGFYFKQEITAQQLAKAEQALDEAKARNAYLEDELEIAQMSAEGEEERKYEAFLEGARAKQANPDIVYGYSKSFQRWEQG